jgi:hypothetical protein
VIVGMNPSRNNACVVILGMKPSRNSGCVCTVSGAAAMLCVGQKAATQTTAATIRLIRAELH